MTSQLGALLLVYAAFVFEAAGIAADVHGVEPRWLLLAAAHLVWTLRSGPAVLWSALCGLLWAGVTGGDLSIGLAILACASFALSWIRRDRRWTSVVAYLLTMFTLVVVSLLAVDGLQTVLSGQSFPEPRRWLLTACAQGAITSLWGGALWCAARVGSSVVRRIVPPLDWRTAKG
jgi:cell shape-determining protein MreD